MTPPFVRRFEAADTDACYTVCLRTADNGDDASALYTAPGIAAEVWLGPYLALYPDFAMVAEDSDGVCAYVVGVPDTRAYEARAEAEWWPRLRTRYPRGSYPAGTPDADCVELIHGPERMPDELVRAYPAHLHIDLLPRARKQGVGRDLMGGLFQQVRAVGAAGIHLGCSPDNTNAIAFYRHLGFEDLMGGRVWGRSTGAI